MKHQIYADNAATTQLSTAALGAMMPFLTTEYGNASQPYTFSKSCKRALAEARECIATCINASPEEIYFTSGGTESDNWAIKGTMYAKGDDRTLITSQVEHHAVLNSASAVEKMGHQVIYLPVDSACMVSTETLKSIISPQTKLVSVMFSNNEVGTIQPISELALISHKNGSVFHTDAVQAVGHVPIDVKTLGIDMLSASAHKFNGPKGIGFLYVKAGTPLKPYNEGGAQEFGMRAGTENIASIVGMATALRENCESMARNQEHLQMLETELLAGIEQAGLDYIHNGSVYHLPGNVSLSFRNADGEMLLHRLDLMGICISTGAACDSLKTRISHVLTAMNVPQDYIRGTIRISLGKNNTLGDVESIAKCLKKIIG